MSDSLRPHELQHARPPCPSPTPGVHPDSCPSSQWCHSSISSSVVPFSSCPQYPAIKKNAFKSVLMRSMKLEPIIQSEVSQKEKHQYSMLTHIYMELRMMVMMTLYVRQQKRHRCKEQTFGLWEKARVG